MYTREKDHETMSQIGRVRTQRYVDDLSKRLPSVMERCGLGIQETEVLLQLASTVMEMPSPSIYRVVETLMLGLQDFAWITSSEEKQMRVKTALLQALPGVRYGVVSSRSGKPVTARCFMSMQVET